MYKSSDDKEESTEKEEKYDEEGIFGATNFFGWASDKGENNKEENNKADDILEEFDIDEVKHRKKNTNVKTHRNRKHTGSSRRRY